MRRIYNKQSIVDLENYLATIPTDQMLNDKEYLVMSFIFGSYIDSVQRKIQLT